MDNKKIVEEIACLLDAIDLALNYLSNFNRKKLLIQRSFFLMVHKKLLAYRIQDAGRYRITTDEIKIPGSTFNHAQAWEIEFKINDLIEFINNRRKWYPVYKKHILDKLNLKNDMPNRINATLYKIFIAFYVHHKITKIHPFVDGNGRMARLVMCLLLRYENMSSLSFPLLINTIIKEDKNKYLDALNAADSGNYVTSLEYMIDVLSTAYAASLEKVEDEAKKGEKK